LSIHDKPIYLSNTASFYDFPLGHVEKMLEENFFYNSIQNSFTVVNTPDQIFSATP